jgi:hypothetical protein
MLIQGDILTFENARDDAAVSLQGATEMQRLRQLPLTDIDHLQTLQTALPPQQLPFRFLTILGSPVTCYLAGIPDHYCIQHYHSTT